MAHYYGSHTELNNSSLPILSESQQLLILLLRQIRHIYLPGNSLIKALTRADASHHSHSYPDEPGRRQKA